uniref:centrosome and spindle pole-associated protein 1 n=1 Tax=Myxine glutinosa TaxID=7769 RepID=UPI00358F4C9E
MMMGTPDDELEKFLNEQKIRLLQDRATLDQNLPYIDIMAKQQSLNSEQEDKPCKEFGPPFIREKGVSTGELIQPMSFVIGQEYEQRRQHLKEELLQDFCRYMAERAEVGISFGSRHKLSQMRAKTSWAAGGRRFHKDSGTYNNRLHQSSPILAIEPSTFTKHDAATSREASNNHSLLKNNQTLLPKDCDKDSAKGKEQAKDRQMKCVQVTAPYADMGAYDPSELSRAERRKKEKYGRELLAQMAECKINKKREKEFQLAVPISGAVDPQKDAHRLAKMLGSSWKADFSKSSQAVLQPHPPSYPPPKTNVNCRSTHIQHVLSHAQNRLPSPILLHNHNSLPPIGQTYTPSTNYILPHSQVHHNNQHASDMPEPSVAQFGTSTSCGCAIPYVGYTDVQPLPMYVQPHMQTVGLQFSRNCFIPPGNLPQCVPSKQAMEHAGTLSAHDHTEQLKQTSEQACEAQTEEPTGVIMSPLWQEGDDRRRTNKLACHEELKIQMKDKEMQRKRQQNGLSTVEDYNPWGRGGGGAPNHDVHGNILTDLRKMHQQNKANRDTPSLQNPLDSPTSASPQNGTKNSLLGKQKELPASQMELYKLFLRKQMEEDSRRRAEEKRTARELDEQEERRVTVQREKMAQEYEKEQAIQRQKDMEKEKKIQLLGQQLMGVQRKPKSNEKPHPTKNPSEVQLRTEQMESRTDSPPVPTLAHLLNKSSSVEAATITQPCTVQSSETSSPTTQNSNEQSLVGSPDFTNHSSGTESKTAEQKILTELRDIRTAPNPPTTKPHLEFRHFNTMISDAKSRMNRKIPEKWLSRINRSPCSSCLTEHPSSASTKCRDSAIDTRLLSKLEILRQATRSEMHHLQRAFDFSPDQLDSPHEIEMLSWRTPSPYYRPTTARLSPDVCRLTAQPFDMQYYGRPSSTNLPEARSKKQVPSVLNQYWHQGNREMESVRQVRGKKRQGFWLHAPTESHSKSSLPRTDSAFPEDFPARIPARAALSDRFWDKGAPNVQGDGKHVPISKTCRRRWRTWSDKPFLQKEPRQKECEQQTPDDDSPSSLKSANLERFGMCNEERLCNLHLSNADELSLNQSDLQSRLTTPRPVSSEYTASEAWLRIDGDGDATPQITHQNYPTVLPPL